MITETLLNIFYRLFDVIGNLAALAFFCYLIYYITRIETINYTLKEHLYDYEIFKSHVVNDMENISKTLDVIKQHAVPNSSGESDDSTTPLLDDNVRTRLLNNVMNLFRQTTENPIINIEYEILPGTSDSSVQEPATVEAQ